MACILMSDQLGYGVLCVPSAYRQLGYVGASVAILLLSAITTYTGLLLTRIRTERPDITSYKQLFGYVFNHPLASMYASACVSLFLFAVICSSVLVQANAWNTFFPKTCSFRWVLLASATTAVLLQIRTIPKIGLVSVANCVCLMIFNVYLLYSFATYIQSGTHKAGRKVPFPSDSVEAWVAVFDILFSFAGHVVFLELMQEMSNPDE
jgi:amino acid permease